MLPAAGREAPRAWEAQAAEGEVGSPRVRHPDQAVPAKTLMIPVATGRVTTAPMLISVAPLLVQCVNVAGKPLFHL